MLSILRYFPSGLNILCVCVYVCVCMCVCVFVCVCVCNLQSLYMHMVNYILYGSQESLSQHLQGNFLQILRLEKINRTLLGLSP